MQNQPRSGFAWLVPFLPLAGLVAALLVFMDGVQLVPSSADASFAVCSIVAAVVVFAACCLFFAVRSALLRVYAIANYLRFGGIVAGASVLFTWLIDGRIEPGVLSVLGGAVFGFGLASVSIRWYVALVRLDERRTFSTIASVCLVAALLKGAIIVFGGLLPEAVALSLTIVLLSVLLAVSSWVPWRPTADDSSCMPFVGDVAAARDAEGGGRTENALDQVKGMLSRNWIVFCGLVLCLTVAAGIWGNVLVVRPAVGPDARNSVIGSIVGALILVLAARLLDDKVRRQLYLALPLICVASFVVVWFFRDVGMSVSFIPLGFSMVVCGCLHVSCLSAEPSDGLSPVFSFSLLASVAAIAFLAWFIIWPLLGFGGASVADLILKVAYLVAVAVYLIVSAQRPSADVESGSEPTLDEICSQLSERIGLSERESEVLLYLAQGRSSSYIAERQFISINTVKTHIKRIHAKAGVRSKQELLDLIYTKK